MTTRGKQLWCVDINSVAEQESLIWRKYWDEEPQRNEEMEVHQRQIAEARSATEQQEYQSTLEKIGIVHRRVREAAANAIRRLSS